MSSISTTPRRPSTAQPTPLSTRLPYEAAEALLWERQNSRANTHLHAQMKALQSAHEAYNARIAAIEAVADAAEAAVARVRGLERKVEALEADEREGPFVAWCKEAVTGLQGSVEGIKGLRQRVCALDGRVERLGEDVEGVRDEGGVVRGVVKRLEVLEGGRREEGRRAAEVQRLSHRQEDSRQRECEREGVEEALGEAQEDDNPLAVFYGIETQSPSKRQDRERTSTAARPQGRSPGRLTESPQRHGHTGVLPPPDEDTVRPEDDSFDLLEAVPEIEYGWENTQQFKDMQKELAALRAMCRAQEPKSSNEAADATQRPQETLIVGTENNAGFSDATTEMEVECNDNGRQFHQGTPPGSVSVLSSDTQIPSSPPKRTEMQSARRNLMKRPSIYDPRVPSVNEHVQPERAAPPTCEDPARDSSSSLLVKLPVDAPTTDKTSGKRKRVDDAPAQRVTRPKLGDDRTAPRKPVAPAAQKDMIVEETAVAEQMPLTFGDETPAPLSPTRRTFGKQKQAVDRSLQQAVPQAVPSRQEQPILPTKSAMSVAETVKSRKAISKPKPKPTPAPQQAPPEAAPGSSRQAPATVKKDTKGPRQSVGACKSCRLRHQKCDRTQPACGRCAKLGTPCQYPPSSTATAAPASSPKKKQAHKKSAIEAGRERSVTVSPGAPRQKSSAKRPMPTSPSKKPTVAAAPTATSSRTTRAKNTRARGISPKKK
ncbi:uncharacterized protein M421DRAFT_2060 [Didymella exigua CBS 183.55]|uniref:Zn(2)-C6 fungal-type domain-containing protein n=1 Tax=Didymella exigua CBS 183.55 TaxID=1150837 RepID=A0A6A5S4K0_9PLEO|nr:uncharacterized protein M421DRAFT_2060 [Didymella exigua CBS 183.55]KAF1932437.1 hypothetical protein M421DRAFT_2060 [Didymella exigua CBS 183.55]